MKRLVVWMLIALCVISACGQTPALPPTSTPSAAPTLPPTDTPVPPTSTPQPTETPISKVTLRRGLNLANMLEAPNEGDWGMSVQEEYFSLMRQAGFDFVRLPISWNSHADPSFPYMIDPSFFARVDQVLDWALKQNLVVILDLHNYEAMSADPWSHKDRFLEIWRQIAEHYQSYPQSVLFELLNEPNTELDAALWNEYAAEAIKVIREANPTRDVVIGPTQWNSYGWVSTLDIPDDPHLIVTFHYYEPFHFTHQGAEWAEGADGWLGTTWDATAEQKGEVIANFDVVANWAKRHGNVRILLGEFGVYSKAPQDSRVRWMAFIREQAEAHRFAWAYWEFNGGFGVYDPVANIWRDDLLKALIP